VCLVGHEDNWRADADITRVNLSNMKEKTMLLLKTYLCIVKYLDQEPGHFAYLLV